MIHDEQEEWEMTPDPAQQKRRQATDQWFADCVDSSEADARDDVDDELDETRLSRLLFLHAALQRLHQPNPDDIDRRVERVMLALSENGSEVAEMPPQPAVFRPRRRWIVSVVGAIAATVLGVMFWSANTAGSAHAAVRSAVRSAELAQDRQYQVTARVEGEPEEKIAKLYVRGGEKFLVECASPFGGALRLGADFTQAWIVPSIGPVIVSNDPISMGQWIVEHRLPLPFLQITTILEQLSSQDYELRLFDDAVGDSPAGRSWRHVQGRAQHPTIFRPAVIDVWVDAEDGTVQRVVVDWQSPRMGQEGQTAELSVATLRFDLVSRDTYDDGWYTYAQHAPPDQPVIELGRKPSEQRAGQPNPQIPANP